MKLDDLLAEYSATLQSPAGRGGLPPLAELARQSQRSSRGWWWASGAAIATAAVFVVLLAAPRAPRASPRAIVQGAMQANVHATVPAHLPTTLQAAPLAARRPRAMAQAQVRRAPERPRPSRLAVPPDQPFVPLIENSMLPAPAMLQLVRVSVRPERLAELGIAWQRGGTSSGGLVDAEVLLGDDGIARALRVPGAE